MILFDIPATEKTPRISFDTESRIFSMDGNSRPEDVREFYMPVIEKMDAYFSSESPSEVPYFFSFKLGYFNSSSAKFISDILLGISDYIDKGFNIKIRWFFEEGDEDMREAGRDFSEMIKIDFEFIVHKF